MDKIVGLALWVQPKTFECRRLWAWICAFFFLFFIWCFLASTPIYDWLNSLTKGVFFGHFRQPIIQFKDMFLTAWSCNYLTLALNKKKPILIFSEAKTKIEGRPFIKEPKKKKTNKREDISVRRRRRRRRWRWWQPTTTLTAVMWKMKLHSWISLLS